MNELRFLESAVKMPLMLLPVRSVLVALPTAQILISPGSQLTEEQLRSAGNVTDLVVTNLFHCAGILKALKVFPKARVWGVPGCKEAKPDIPWTDILTYDAWLYSNELKMHGLKGMPKVNEVVFLHLPSKSLIVADLCFNMLDSKGFGAWLILSLFGTYKKLAVSKFFMSAVKNREAFVDSLQQLFLMEFDQIIVSHGSNVPANGKEILKQALFNRGIKI